MNPTTPSPTAIKVKFLFASSSRSIGPLPWPSSTSIGYLKSWLFQEEQRLHDLPPGDLAPGLGQGEKEKREWKWVWNGGLLNDEMVLEDMLRVQRSQMGVGGSEQEEEEETISIIVTPLPGLSSSTPPTPATQSHPQHTQPSSTSTSAPTQPTSRLLPTPDLSHLLAQPPQPNPAYLSTKEALFYYEFQSDNQIRAFLGEPLVLWQEAVRGTAGTEHGLATGTGTGVGEEVMRQAGEGVLRWNDIGLDGRVRAGDRAGMDDGGLVDWAGMDDEGEEMVLSATRNEKKEMELSVQMSGRPYKLMIPDPDRITMEQKRSLGRYARDQRIVHRLRELLEATPAYLSHQPVVPAASLGVPAGSAGRTGRHQRLATERRRGWVHWRNGTLTVRIACPDPTFLVVVLGMMAYSAFKVGMVLYMFTRGAKHWDDPRWFLPLFVAIGWWIWDCTVKIRKARRVRDRAILRAREEERVRRNEERVARGERPVERRTAATTSTRPVAAALGPWRVGIRVRLREYLGLIGIRGDRAILRLFEFTPDWNSPTPFAITIEHPQIPSTDLDLPRAGGRPGWYWTRIGFPLVLMLVSLVPAWDQARKEAIRDRERHMRLLVQKLTMERERRRKEAVEVAERRRAELDVQEGTVQEQSEVIPNTSPMPTPTPTSTPTLTTGDPPEPIIPRGLCPEAIAYYRRIIGTAETIDWEQERRAQADLLRGARNGNANGDGNGNGNGNGEGEEGGRPVLAL